MKKLKAVWNFIKDPSILTPIILLITLGGIVLIFTLSRSNFDWEGVLVESWGMLFDILFLLILLSIFNKIQERRLTIKRYIKEIEDFRGWKNDEAGYRIVGNLKRLRDLGYFYEDLKGLALRGDLSFLELNNQNLQECDFSTVKFSNKVIIGANLDNTLFRHCFTTKLSFKDIISTHIDFASSKLIQFTAINSNLRRCNFMDSYMSVGKMINSVLSNNSFKRSEIQHFDFSETQLLETVITSSYVQDCNLSNQRFNSSHFNDSHFENSNFSQCSFTGASLNGCSFIGANFTGADFRQCYITDCQFDNADFSDANLEGVIKYIRKERGRKNGEKTLRRIEFNRRGVPYEVFLMAKSLKNAKIEPQLLRYLTLKAPHLF